jgi:uncharacterized protein
MAKRKTGSHKLPQQASKPLIRALLIAVGALSLGLGVLGIFMPLLPTTPFLLLAAACFIRSSSRLYTWLITHPWFGDYIYYYQRYRAISLHVKVSSLVMLWLTIGYSVIWAIESWGVRALLIAIAVGVTTHLVRLKTLTPELRGEVEGDSPLKRAPSPVSSGKADPGD